MKKQELFSVAKVETNDTLRDVSRENREIYFRVAISPNGGVDGMTEEQRVLFDKMNDKAKEIVLKGALKHEISNVFKASSFIPSLVNLTDEQLTDEYQDGVVKKLETAFKEKDENGNPQKFLFTYYTYSVEELLAGTEYSGTSKLYDAKDKILRQRNSLYFGFADDEENVFSFMRDRLIDAIDNAVLSIEPNNAAAQPKEKAAEQEAGEKAVKNPADLEVVF